MVKTLEQINQEFLDEYIPPRTEKPIPESAEDYDRWLVGLLDDVTESESEDPEPADAAETAKASKTAEADEADEADETDKAEEAAADAKAQPATPEKKPNADKNRKVARRISDVVFFTVIALILIATLVYSGKTNNGVSLFGYSGFTVLSGSMQREIPEGSLVITKKVDPETIKIGDDITFVTQDNVTVTHRVVNVIENYDSAPQIMFQTQGLENPEPDFDLVYAGNVIGVVKYTIPELGYILLYISNNIGITFMVLGGVLVAVIALSKLFSGNRRRKDKLEPEAVPA